MKQHHLQAGAGHYGVFSVSTWEQLIYPVVRSFIGTHDVTSPAVLQGSLTGS